LGAYGLDDQWLVIDRQWRKEVEEATRKREFNASAEIPLRKQRYVEIIDHLASGDTLSCFSAISVVLCSSFARTSMVSR
jgi:hypothetical protein